MSEKIRVFVIDPDPFSYGAIRDLLELETQDMEAVGSAQTGQEGLEKVAALKPNVVLIDSILPDAADIIKRMRGLADPPMIISIGKVASKEALRSLLIAGVGDFMLKPFTLESVAKIRNNFYRDSGAALATPFVGTVPVAKSFAEAVDLTTDRTPKPEFPAPAEDKPDTAHRIETAIFYLRSPDAETRSKGTETLVNLGARAVKALIVTLQDPDPKVRRGVAFILGQIGDMQAVEALAAALRDGDAEVRKHAAEALGKLGDAKAVKPLMDSLRDPAKEVSRAAIEALRKIGTAEALEALAAYEDYTRQREQAAEKAEPTRELPSEPAEGKLAEELPKPVAAPPPPAAAIPPPPLPVYAADDEEDTLAAWEDADEEDTVIAHQEAPSASFDEEDTVIGREDAPLPQAAPPRQPAPQPSPPPAPAGYFGGSLAGPLAASGPAQPYTTAAGWDQLAQEYLNPQFTAFYPGVVQPQQQYVLLVFVHIESAIEKVREVAGSYKPMLGARPVSGTVRTTQKVEAGETLTLIPQIEGLTFQPERQKIIWEAGRDDAGYQYVSFPFTTPAVLTQDLRGRVLVLKGAIIVGEIPVTLLVLGAASQQEAQFRKFDPIFASYSYRDTPVMNYMRKMRAKLGQKMLVDIYDLRAGDHWSDRLLQMIDESAIFQLFWSKHSAASPYCKQEWEHALKYVNQRDRFIQPVYWTSRLMPPPPPELSKIHFEQIEPPIMTRVQLLRQRLGNLLGGR